MRYAKLLATLSGAGAIAAGLTIPAHGTGPSVGSRSYETTAPGPPLPMCHQATVGSCSAIPRTAEHRPSSPVHGRWQDPFGACVTHIVSFDRTNGALTCKGTSAWTGTWVGSTAWTLTGRQNLATGAISGRIREVFDGHARHGGRGTLTFVERVTIDAAGRTDIRGHVVRASAGLADSRGHVRWIGRSSPDGSGSGTYSGRWRAGR